MKSTRLIQPVKRSHSELPLSSYQERLWLVNQKHPRDLSYNIPVSFWIEGALDTAALNQSLTEILRRHQTLRVKFVANPRGEPAQIVQPLEGFELPVVPATEDEIAHHVKENAEHVFDLSSGKILIGRLLCLNPQKHLLLLNVHHIAADGWSIEGILFSELQVCYAAFCSGAKPQLSALEIQYSDFAHWHRKQDLSADLVYWQECLADYEDSLELPTDFPRQAQSGVRSEAFAYKYPKELSLELERFAQAHGCTIFMYLLAGFALTISRYTGREDLCIGTTTSGRMLPELEGLIGFFINILPLRMRIDEELTVDEYLGAVRKVAVSGFDHQLVPFERILYSLSRTQVGRQYPLVPLVLRHQNYPHTHMEGELPGGVKLLPYPEGGGDKVIAALGAAPRAEVELSYTGTGENLEVDVMFAADLYRRETVERLLRHHEELLRAMMADGSRRLRDLPMLTQADIQCLAGEYDHSFDDPKHTFVQRWKAQVERTPDAIACHDAHRAWSYREIADYVDRLAHALAAKGVVAGEVVGVCLDRGAPLLVSLLAIWTAGAAYVPLDPSYPETYLRQILQDASPKQTICTVANQSKLGLADATSCVLDASLARLQAFPPTPPSLEYTADALAYVMYTSGSTGTPKGVRVPHRQLMNWLGGLERNWPFSSGEVIAQKTTMAFAVSVKEIFAGLLNGCTTVFLDTATVQDTASFVAALTEHRVSRLNLVPSHLQAVLAYMQAEQLGLPALQFCITAGEPLTAELVSAFRALLPNARLLNNYGCTELNDITYFEATTFEAQQRFVPIGKPIQNTRLYVMDRRGRLVPPGVAGELHVATESMSDGYHNLPELTRERYLRNYINGEQSGVLYNTGDVVKCLPDGNLEYIGRWDFQVKVRGFRVDVRQVEKAMGEFEGMGLRAVVGDGRQLFAYYVTQAGKTIDIASLREYLQARLPAYMVPSVFVALDAMPRLPNGKLDRRALIPAMGRLQRSDVYEAPKTATEVVMAALWAEALEIPEDEIGRHTHFFEVGGHSLSATRLVARIKERLGLELGISQVFEYPRLDELSQHVEETHRAGHVEAHHDDEWMGAHRADASARRLLGAPGLLENKVVLVTGSSRGIGSATVRLLASQGAAVAINYLQNGMRANRVKELVEHDGGVAEVFQGDVTDPAQVTRLVGQVKERFGGIDVLVANAAIGFKVQPFLDFDWCDFERKVTDELKSIFYLCQAIVPDMVARKNGSIVAVSCAASNLAQPGFLAHSAGKAALDAFIRSLALELGPEGVRVNTVAPGLTVTDATANLPRQQKEAVAARSPLRRNGLPRDVAGAVLFLASDLSQFMTGTCLPVDGGISML